MKNTILEIIESSCENKNFDDIENIFNLYEQLQYSANIKQIAEDVFSWLNTNFKVDNLKFSLFDLNTNSKEDLFVKGEEFFLDDDLSFFFIVNTHTNLNATLSFSATSKSHYEILQEKYTLIQAALFQIAPVIQSGILKKNYVESSSLDSVTNVFTRNYLIENLTKHMRLSSKKINEIFFLMVGIDHFKAVIDEFDYDIGDKVLIELAKIIHSNINEFDMVARLNGDEFLITILSSNDKNDVTKLSHNIIKDFADISILVNEENEQYLKKTICIGLETYEPNSSIPLTDSIKNADIALYEAKNKGRSTLFDYKDLQAEDTIDLF